VSGGYIGRFAGKLITLPVKILNPIGELLAQNPEMVLRFSLKDIPRAPIIWTPKTALLKPISSLSVAPGIIAHSIIPVKNPDDPKDKWNDGLLPMRVPTLMGWNRNLL